MRRGALLLAAVLSLLVAALVSAPTSGCGGKDAAAPEEDVCSKVSFSQNGSVAFNMGCNSITSDIHGITYDQFSRRTAYDFTIRCTTGGTSYSGTVRNIRWDNLGRALGADVTVNGKLCRF